MIIDVPDDRVFTRNDGTERKLSEIVQECYSYYEDGFYQGLTKITDFSVGSEAYNLLLFVSNIIFDRETESNLKQRNYLINLAEGSALDDWGDRACISRNEAEFTVLPVIFSIPTVKNVDTVIPTGTEVSSNDYVVFSTTEELIIPAGVLNGEVEVICNTPGIIGNVKSNEIFIINSLLDYPVTVNNPGSGTNGVDNEDDEAFRTRIKETACNYPPMSRSWIEKISQKVVDSSKYVYNSSNKTGTLYYKSDKSNAQNDLVELFNNPVYNPADVDLLFNSANKITVINTNSKINITLDGSVIFNVVKIEATNIINDFFNNMKVNQNFKANCLLFQLQSIAGVLGVSFTNINDVIININEYAGSITPYPIVEA
ncbi:baseplate J/gp47 family protein [Methanobrevibacter curvatus]|uniref:Baseplate J-like protein n=1 Tax=Methanobrevibacter curvatus TaxID=49547 RepID=A0A166CB08_9EURY|nr:baseplate J/gp47 family protein [Methanobrevibacter curvatus]KZX14318.1 baseplate J-like protein [Methanobrevibacter curvatus]